MPLIINDRQINYLDGPENASIFIPKVKDKPIIFLIGEVHDEIENGCRENSTNFCDFMNELNILAETHETHFYAEDFLNDDINSMIYNENCETIKEEFKEHKRYLEHKGCMKIIHDNNFPCYYNNFKQKCSTEFNESCAYPNIKWQYLDPRYYTDFFTKISKAEELVEPILNKIFSLTDISMNNRINRIIKNIKISKGKMSYQEQTRLRTFLRTMDLGVDTEDNIKDPITRNLYNKYIIQEPNDEIIEFLNNSNTPENKTDKEEYRLLKSLLDNNELRRGYFNTVIKAVLKKIEEYNYDHNFIQLIIDLLDENVEFIDRILEHRIFSKQLNKMNLNDEQLMELRNKFKLYLNIVNNQKTDIPKNIKEDYFLFIREIFRTLLECDLSGNDNSRNEQLFGQLYDRSLQILNETDINYAMSDKRNLQNIMIDFFTRPISAIPDIYFFLRISKHTSSPKLIVSLMGKMHVLSQTDYYEMSGDYDVYKLSASKPLRQCMQFLKTIYGDSFDINLNDELSLINIPMRDQQTAGYTRRKNKKQKKSKRKIWIRKNQSRKKIAMRKKRSKRKY